MGPKCFFFPQKKEMHTGSGTTWGWVNNTFKKCLGDLALYMETNPWIALNKGIIMN